MGNKKQRNKNESRKGPSISSLSKEFKPPSEFPKPAVNPEPIPGQIPEDLPITPPEIPKAYESPKPLPGHIPEDPPASPPEMKSEEIS